MKIKIIFFILVVTIIGCNNKNSKSIQLQSNSNDSIKVENIASTKNVLDLIDSIRGPKNEWCYILGNRINDSIYSSIRILSQNKDTLYFIDKYILKNTKGIDVRAEFSAFKILSNNRKELIINGVDSLFHAYGDDATITWNSSKNVFETEKYQQVYSLNGGSFGDCFLAGTKGAIFGGASAMATAGIGDIFGSVGDVGNELLRAGAHAVAQGGISELSGGNFWQGADAGAFGSLGGSAFEAYGGILKESALRVVGFSALSGGIGAALSGGNFWGGAFTGATIGLLNHYYHSLLIKNRQKAYDEMVRLAEAPSIWICP